MSNKDNSDDSSSVSDNTHTSTEKHNEDHELK